MLYLPFLSKSNKCQKNILATAVFALSLSSFPVYAIDLQGIIKEAVDKYPSMTAARAAVESAQSQVKQYKLQHMPVIGVQSSQPLSGASTSQGALVGTLNLYSGGAIEQQVRTYQYAEEYQRYKMNETAVDLAYTIAQVYLQGLSTKEKIESLQQNVNRHQKIIDDLLVITHYDQGRRTDLIQAQSRQLQIKTTILQLQSDLAAAENKLQEYLSSPQKVDWLPLSNIQVMDMDVSQHPTLLAQYANEKKVESEYEYYKKSRRPKVDLQVVRGGNSENAENLVLNWNFLDMTKSAGQEAAQAQVKAAKAQEEQAKRLIMQRVTTAKIQAEKSLLTINGAKEQVKTAKAVADAYEQQFMIARRSILDVLNAYSEWSNLETSLISAQGVYRQALIDQKYAAGQLVQWALNPVLTDQSSATRPTTDMLNNTPDYSGKKPFLFNSSLQNKAQ